jgi:hypothetical protein
MAGKQWWNKRYEPRTSAKMHRKFPEEVCGESILGEHIA